MKKKLIAMSILLLTSTMAYSNDRVPWQGESSSFSSRPTIYTQEKPIVRNQSDKIVIERVNLTVDRKWTEIHVQTGKRDIMHCSAFNIDGTFIGSVDWPIEQRHTTILLKESETDTVQCAW